MSLEYALLRNHFPFLEDDLLLEIADYGEWIEVEPVMQLLRESQYVKFIPIVLTGLVKVFTQFENKELLLYCIKPSES